MKKSIILGTASLFMFASSFVFAAHAAMNAHEAAPHHAGKNMQSWDDMHHCHTKSCWEKERIMEGNHHVCNIHHPHYHHKYHYVKEMSENMPKEMNANMHHSAQAE